MAKVINHDAMLKKINAKINLINHNIIQSNSPKYKYHHINDPDNHKPEYQ